MSRLVEHTQHDLLERENYLNTLLYRSFDAAILVGSHDWSRLTPVLRCLKIGGDGSSLIIAGSGDGIFTGYDRISHLSDSDIMTKVDVFLVGGDTSLSEGMLCHTATFILGILLEQKREKVVLSGEKDNLLKVVMFLRDLIIKDHDRYGQIHLYAVPLPQEVE